MLPLFQMLTLEPVLTLTVPLTASKTPTSRLPCVVLPVRTLIVPPLTFSVPELAAVPLRPTTIQRRELIVPPAATLPVPVAVLATAAASANHTSSPLTVPVEETSSVPAPPFP
jgi:hypothetical protein